MTSIKKTLLWIQEQPETGPAVFQKIEQLLTELDKPNPFMADTSRINRIDDALVDHGDYIEIYMEGDGYLVIKNTEQLSERKTTIREALDVLVNEK